MEKEETREDKSVIPADFKLHRRLYGEKGADSEKKKTKPIKSINYTHMQ